MNLQTKHTIFGLILLLFLFYSCKENSRNKVKDGLYIEDVSDSDDENKYNFDNKIYKPSKEFYFSYSYLKDGKEYIFAQGSEDWMLFNKDSTIHKGFDKVKSIKLKVANGNPMKKYIDDYNQTVIFYSFPPKSSYNSTGLVENDKNVWMHPPREDLFRILELNPFPFIKKPYEVGTTWNWGLTFGDNWSSEKWKIWTGDVESLSTYTITGKEYLFFDNKKIECHIIEARAKSRLGETYLKAYFNEEFGFVSLEYENIDKSQIIIKLEKIQ